MYIILVVGKKDLDGEVLEINEFRGVEVCSEERRI